MLPHLTTADPPVKDWYDACFNVRILVPNPGCSVMPCSDCHRMLDLKDMRDVQPSGWQLWRRRVVCEACRSKYLRGAA